MGKIQHILHNALHSWIGPAGSYKSDTTYIQDGEYRLSELTGLWALITRFAKEVGIEEVKGKVRVRSTSVCDGKKHYKGKEYFIKLITEKGMAFAYLRVVYWKHAKKVCIKIL